MTITIARAPAYLTIQDEGRRFTRSAGVPRGGAMDSFAVAAANILVGNEPEAPALEWALTAGSIRFDQDAVVAIAGANVDVTVAGRPVAPLTATVARRGEDLAVGAFVTGRFLYIAFSGGIDVPTVLGSSATYLPAKFGGLDGRMLRTGDKLAMRASKRGVAGFQCPDSLAPNYSGAAVRITRGPQAELFGDDSWRTLLTSEFRVSHTSDRTGYRLEGASIPHSLGTLASEAGSAGAIQVPLDGNPIVLMADAPTVGGYPKIAVVAEADLPILAQKAPGQRVQFELVGIEESQRALRRRAADLAMLADKRDSHQV